MNTIVNAHGVFDTVTDKKGRSFMLSKYIACTRGNIKKEVYQTRELRTILLHERGYLLQSL